MATLERSETVSVSDLLSEEVVEANLQAESRDEVFELLVEMLDEAGKLPHKEEVLKAVREREDILSTGIGNGLAIPHAKTDSVSSLVAAFARVPDGVDFKSLDGKPAYLIFLLVSPQDEAGLHVRALSRISRLLKNAHFRDRLMEADTAQKILEIVQEEEENF